MKFKNKLASFFNSQNDNSLKLASVSEQVLFSGCNFLSSIAILKVGSVKDFGIYSFIFTLVTLGNGIFASLIHRQMQLDIASKIESEQNRGYRASFFLELALIALLVVAAILTVLVTKYFQMKVDLLLLLAVASYLLAFNIFELNRRYLYCRNMQVNSFKITLRVFVGLVLLLTVYVLIDNQYYAIHLSFVVLAVAFMLGLFLNKLCTNILFNKRIKVEVSKTASTYFLQGKYGFLGMLATWLQNQSINPFLMYVAGPLVVGYFALGRLMVMPIAVIANGLTSSALPKLRRYAKKNLKESVFDEIKSQSLLVTIFAVIYSCILFLLHVTGFFDAYVPEYQSVKYYLLFWIVALPIINFRFWRTQYFIAHVKMDLVLRVALMSTAIVASTMLIITYIFKTPVFSILGLVLAEFVAIIVLTVLIKGSIKTVSTS